MEDRQHKPEPAPGSSWRRLAWFVAIWAGGVLALGLAAWLLRLVMNAIGMKG
ncbi:DUF2474 family protein [Thauera sp. WH-1]|uniref:DUF2474 family protein n=1 Tax=Thauera sp. WH-1 TaxID=3398230 RepID=UPI0039FC6462